MWTVTLASSLFSFLNFYYPEDVGNKFIQDTGTYLQNAQGTLNVFISKYSHSFPCNWQIFCCNISIAPADNKTEKTWHTNMKCYENSIFICSF
jgi:hypothetical protein